VNFVFDSSPDLSRQVRNALEDEAAQPLSEVQRRAPEGCEYFSELEASIGEWSFGYGVAWALARVSDPMLPSSVAARVAEAAVNDAWRLFSDDQGWTALMAEDRAERGPVEGEQAAPEAEPSSDLGQFMHQVGRSRARRELRGTGTDG
jgi:hypothetical protein